MEWQNYHKMILYGLLKSSHIAEVLRVSSLGTDVWGLNGCENELLSLSERVEFLEFALETLLELTLGATLVNLFIFQ